MSKQASPTTQLVIFMVHQVGMRDAVKVGTFIVAWGTVARKLKREPTWAEYCAYWKESRASYYRELRLLRKVWPEDKNPQRVWTWVEGQIPVRSTVDDAVSALFLSGMAS
jgi:hypothetical protein